MRYLDKGDYIDLSSLPIYPQGNIKWKSICNNKVRFKYRYVEGELLLVKDLGLNSSKRRMIQVLYCGEQFVICNTSIMNCKLRDIIYKERGAFKYQIDDIVDRKDNVQIRIIDRYKKSEGKRNTLHKYYDVQCLECGYKYYIRESGIDRGDSCPVCSKGSVKIGYNNIGKTNPELVRFLVNKDDQYKYTINSQKRLAFYCPYCNTINRLQPYYIVRNGITCRECSDNISYPNKFMYNVLKQLNIKFDTEHFFDWCKFVIPQTGEWTEGRYDFFIFDTKIIIEMDGGLGHGNETYSKSKDTKEVAAYRDVMKDFLAEVYGYKVIRIDSNYNSYKDRFDYCKESVKSKLGDFFNLSDIDWNIVEEKSLKSKIIETIDLYNEGNSVNEIEKILDISNHTIYEYLKIGNKLKLCNYTSWNTKEKEKQRKRREYYQSKPFICVETGYAFKNGVVGVEGIKKLMDLEVNLSMLYNALRNEKEYKGFNWKRITKEDFDIIKNDYPDKAYGDLFNNK